MHEKYCLGASDFISYTDAELDQFASEVKTSKGAGDQRPQAPGRFDEWVARVRRQTDVWCLAYGEEWRDVGPMLWRSSPSGIWLTPTGGPSTSSATSGRRFTGASSRMSRTLSGC